MSSPARTRFGTVGEVMTQYPVCVRADNPVSEAARQMATDGIGAVLVLDAGELVGICTDRDITVRVTAAKRGPGTTVREACTDRDIATISSGASIEEALTRMRERAVRRLPVITDGSLVGLVGLGDLAASVEPGC